MKSSKKKRSFFYYLAMWGCISTGLVYTAIGIIALLSFFKLKKGGADESSLLVFLDKFFIGKIFIGLILLGMISFIAWRIYETIKDPYGYGKDVMGILKRSVIACSSLADALIAYSAIQVLLHEGHLSETGQPVAQQEFAGNMLRESWGDWVLMLIGIITSITAIIQLGYVIKEAYMERLDIKYLSKWKKATIHVLAWSGHFARGVILGIIGFFYIKAGLSENAQFVVNTDKAFDFIGDHIGHAYFILVALGTICYGFFMFVYGIYFDPDKD
jgi:hypothetical protein